ncbi:MAG: cell envelope integrity protein CreD [Gammaproteobacteria bacterium]|nr:cell envelope integrity protein CreD [Gammaproteobacteria bacterium]
MSSINPIQPIYERSNLIRIALLAFIMLLLQIPIGMVESTIHQRSTTKDEAVAEVTQKWGQAQTLIGPMLIVPYNYTTTDANNPKAAATVVRRHATFLPEHFQIKGQLATETRSRGIFDVPVYQGNVVLSGDFQKPDLSAWQVPPEQILWNEMKLVVGLSDARAIQEQVTLRWDDLPFELQAGTDRGAIVESGFHALVPGKSNRPTHTFTIPLHVNGSTSFYVAPLGKDSRIVLNSDWRDPSFQGNWLPRTRNITEAGFSAEWAIPSLGRNYPQQWGYDESFTQMVRNSTVGVSLIHAVDPYRMSERSVKYQILFLVLTFAAIWLFEILANIKVHPMQYLFIGMALCLFYLLELSLSEHLGFIAAYAVASTAVVMTVLAYTRVVLRARRRAALLGGGLALLYAYLFTLLQEQSYSLLAGSIGLFLALGAVMYLTRNINWFGIARTPIDPIR